MFHDGSLKEYPAIPFIRDNNDKYITISQKNFTKKDYINFSKITGIDFLLNIREICNNNLKLDFNMLIQTNNILINNDNNILNKLNLSFHTWLLKAINNNLCIIPNDPKINIYSKFKYLCISLIPESISFSKSIYIDGTLAIKSINGNTSFLPLNSCKFIINSDNNFYIYLSIIKDACVYINDNNNIESKKIPSIAVTLHVIVKKYNKNVLQEISDYLKYNLNLYI